MAEAKTLTDDDSLLQGQMDFLARSAASSSAFTVLLTVLLSVGLWQHTPSIINISWTGMMLLLTAVRFVHAKRYLSSRPNLEDARQFEKLFIAGALASGLGWGSAAIVLFPFSSVPHQSFLSFAMAGITASAITLYAPLKWALRSYLGLTLIPLAAVHFSQGDEAHIAMGALIVVYIGLMFRFVALANSTLVHSLALRNENNQLIAELQTAKQQSDRINQKLKAEIAFRAETESNLIEARDRAEHGARSKAEFLATMSHEIRTPMNGVLGMTELLLSTELSSKQHKFVDTIKRSGTALLAIINDILDYSKIEAGKLELDDTPFDLRQLVEDTMVFFAEQAQRKKVELASDFPPDQHTAYSGDPERIRQILMNLLGNAVKFTDHGEITLTVAGSGVEGDHETLSFSVRDTGVGIAPEHQTHIFGSFQQADGSTTRKFGGTGLGLAICNRLVELMGGEISLTSTPNIGSTFSFSVSLKRQPECILPKTQGVEVDLSGLQILIVDSNDTAREILKQQLERWGIRTYAANTADFAFKYLAKSVTQRKPFDIVLFDHQLGDLKGLEFARKVRGLNEFSNLRLVMLTTVNMLEQTGQWMAAGIDNYVSKPVRQTELRETLSDVAVAGISNSPSAPQKKEANDRGLGAHVLLAEDNPVNQELARNMLENLGCTATFVEDGQAAYEAIAEAPFDALEKPYDLILMDCQMPRLDGFEATEKIRHWEADENDQQRIPIVALTANALQGDRERCLAAGMDDYVSKPFSQAELSRAISRWLTLDSAARRVALEVEAAPRQKDKSAGEVTAPAAELDYQALDAIRALQQDGKPDVLQHIIELYHDSAPDLLRQMRHAVTASDAATLRAAAHSLKSSSANLGASKLASLCKDLEVCGLEGRTTDAVPLLGIAEFEYEAVSLALASQQDAMAA